MSYIPPAADQVDFDLDGYDGRLSDQADFELADIEILRPAPATLSADRFDPDVSPSGSATLDVDVEDVTITTDGPDLSGVGSVSVGAEVASISLLEPAPPSVALGLSPPPASLTFDPAPIDTLSDAWIIAGGFPGTLTEEIRTWTELTLTFRVDQTGVDLLKPLDSNAGKLEIVERPDGSFRAVDRSNGKQNTTYFAPPKSRASLRYIRDYLVDEYQQRTVDQQGQQYEVTVTLVATAAKEPQGSYGSDVRSSGEWLFEFDAGSFATKRVAAELSQQGKDGVEGPSMELTLTNEQAQILEESAGRQGGVTVHEVPDGPNVVEDNSPGEGNTVAVTVPDSAGDAISSGEYIVREWESSRENDEWQTVQLSLAAP